MAKHIKWDNGRVVEIRKSKVARVYPTIEYKEVALLEPGFLGGVKTGQAQLDALQAGHDYCSGDLVKAFSGLYPNAVVPDFRSEAIEITAEVDETTLAYKVVRVE